MAATKYAKIRPVTAPNPIPAAFDCTLRANTPLRTPTTIPLKQEPIRMEAIMGRAAGVNQAVAPSTIPRTAPAAIPITGLFIVSPSIDALLRAGKDFFKWGCEKSGGQARRPILRRTTPVSPPGRWPGATAGRGCGARIATDAPRRFPGAPRLAGCP